MKYKYYISPLTKRERNQKPPTEWVVLGCQLLANSYWLWSTLSGCLWVGTGALGLALPCIVCVSHFDSWGCTHKATLQAVAHRHGGWCCISPHHCWLLAPINHPMSRGLWDWKEVLVMCCWCHHQELLPAMHPTSTLQAGACRCGWVLGMVVLCHGQ
jgi:hypothetical protein